MELKEAGLDVGERRVGRLMRINKIKPVRTRRHKVTTDSNHHLGVAANWRQCHKFRVWAGIMGKKETYYVTTQRACDPG